MDLSMPLDLGRLLSAYQQSHAWPSRGELQLINAGSDLDSESSIQLGPPALVSPWPRPNTNHTYSLMFIPLPLS
jgi:hypothetical protein